MNKINVENYHALKAKFIVMVAESMSRKEERFTVIIF